MVTFADRVMLAHEYLMMLFDLNDMLTDSDVLAAAERFTTSVFPEDRIATIAEGRDYDDLKDLLFNMVAVD